MNRKSLLLGGLGISALLGIIGTVNFLKNDSELIKSQTQGFLSSLPQSLSSHDRLLQTSNDSNLQPPPINLTTRNVSNIVGKVYRTIINETVDPSIPRLETHTKTDKSEYRPNDIVFVEVLIVDALTKVPGKADGSDANQTIKIGLDLISQETGEVVQDSYLEQIFDIYDTGVSFALNLDYSALESGRYIVRVYSDKAVASIAQIKVIAEEPVQAAVMPPMVLKAQQLPEFFKPGEIVVGRFKAALTDDTAFQSEPTYTAIAMIDDQPFINEGLVQTNGEGIFKILLPENITQNFVIVEITVSYDVYNATYLVPFKILRPPMPVEIKFMAENLGELVANASHKVYFVATRGDHQLIDIRNASIRAFNLSNYEQPPITIYNRTVSTFVTGLGVFNYTHRPNLQPFIEFMIPGENNMTQIPITVQSFFQGGMMPNMSNETNSTDNSTSGDNSTSTENSTQVNATTEAVFAALEAIQNQTFEQTDNATGIILRLRNRTFSIVFSEEVRVDLPLNMTGQGLPQAFLPVWQNLTNNTNQLSLGGKLYQTVQQGISVNGSLLGYPNISSVAQAFGQQFHNFTQTVQAELNTTYGVSNITEYLISLGQQSPQIGGSDPQQQQPQMAEGPEVTFSLRNRVLNNNEPLQVRIQTNNFVRPQDVYIFQIKLKERIIYQDAARFNRSQVITFNVHPSNFSLLNGGILSANIYRVAPQFYEYVASQENTTLDNVVPPTLEEALQWLEIKGSILFFKKPATTVRVQVKTDKRVYLPGETVNYSLLVVNATTNTTIQNARYYINMQVTDEKAVQRRSSLAGRIFLENELIKLLDFPNLEQTLDYMYMPPQQGQTMQMNDGRVEALLTTMYYKGLIYQTPAVVAISTMVGTLDVRTQVQIQQQFGYLFGASYETFQNYKYVPDNQTQGYPEFFNNLIQQQGQQGGQQQKPPIIQNISPSPVDPFTNFYQSNGSDNAETAFFSVANRTVNSSLTGSFRLSNRVSNFQILVDAVSQQGIIGFSSQQVRVVPPVSIDFRLPEKQFVGDLMNVTVQVTNMFSSNITGSLNITAIDDSLVGTLNQDIFLVPNNRTVPRFLILNVTKASQQAQVTLTFTYLDQSSTEVTVQMTKSLQIMPQGTQRVFTSSGLISSQNYQSDIPLTVNYTFRVPQDVSSLGAGVRVLGDFNAVLKEALKGLYEDNNFASADNAISKLLILSSVFQQFRGVDLSTLPDEILLDIQQAKGLVAQTFNELKRYWVNSTGGFEYFGQAPNNELLNGYAIMMLSQLREFSEIDENVMSQLVNMTMKVKKTGVFLQNTAALDAKFRAPQNITSAFVWWALSESKLPENVIANLTLELNLVFTQANSTIRSSTVLTSDPTLLALAALTFKNFNDSRANQFAQELAKYQAQDGSVGRLNSTAQQYGVFNSIGNDRVVEATALAIITWQKVNNETYANQIGKASAWLLRQFRDRTFGGAFTSFIALRALQTRFGNQENAEILYSFDIDINGTVIGSFNASTLDRKPAGLRAQRISDIVSLESYLVPGNLLTVSLTNTDTQYGQDAPAIDWPFIYQFGVFSNENGALFQSVPPADQSQPTLNLTVTPSYSNNSLGSSAQQNKTLSYSVTVFNKDKTRNVGLVVVTLRPPSCLSFNPVVFNTLKSQKKIADFSYNPETQEVDVYLRGIEKLKSYAFTASFVQSYTGKCALRPFTAKAAYIGDQQVNIRAKY